MELCSAENAAQYLTSLVTNLPTKESSEDEVELKDAVTISVGQLCKKLRKVNGGFTYKFINENDDWNEEHITDDLSPAKVQRHFCESQLEVMIDWSK